MIGSTAIAQAYVGTNQVQRMYLGSSNFYDKSDVLLSGATRTILSNPPFTKNGNAYTTTVSKAVLRGVIMSDGYTAARHEADAGYNSYFTEFDDATGDYVGYYAYDNVFYKDELSGAAPTAIQPAVGQYVVLRKIGGVAGLYVTGDGITFTEIYNFGAISINYIFQGTNYPNKIYDPQIKGVTDIATGYTFSNTVAWGDEFDYSGSPDAELWGLDEGNGYSGWGNGSQQYNRLENANVSGGTLSITAKNESFSGYSYTSSQLVTRDTKMFQYGRFEVRAKLPVTDGMWPAIYMFGQNHEWFNYSQWPECGELDIFELNGNNNNLIHTNIHTGFYNANNGNPEWHSTNIGGTADEFNIYRVDWTPDYIRWFINDVQAFEFVNDGGDHSHWPFDDYYYLLISLSVGGAFVGPIDTGALPQNFEIDYVRYYELLGDYGTQMPEKLPAPVLSTTGGTKYQSDYFFISTVSKPENSTIKWYAQGGYTGFDGDDFAFPPETPLGTYTGAGVAVHNVTGQRSEPFVITVVVVPDP